MTGGSLEQLLDLEAALLSPRVALPERASLLAEDFMEFGSSGRIYDKAAIVGMLDALASPLAPRFEQASVAELAPGVVLLTYRHQCDDGGWTNRASVWVRQGSAWRMRFHQGTPAKA